MKIGNKNIDKNAFIIAEIGNNHEGDFSLACDMISLASKSGADAVKFQTIVPEKLVCIDDKKRIETLKRFQFSYSQYEKLYEYAKLKKVIFLSTPFDLESADFLNKIVPAFKIASCDNSFFPLLKKIAEFGKPILLSTGASEETEIDKSVDFIKDIWKKSNIKSDLVLMHCVSRYPTPPESANLLSIEYLKSRYNLNIGYSDHTLGIDACIAAVVLGARIIEKHFTIDKNYSDFQDHQLSADPKELSLLVEKIRNVELLLGKSEKVISKEEKEIKPLIRRSIAANKDLQKGHEIKENDLIWVRPGTGIPVGDESLIIGKIVNKNISKSQLIRKEDLK